MAATTPTRVQLSRDQFPAAQLSARAIVRTPQRHKKQTTQGGEQVRNERKWRYSQNARTKTVANIGGVEKPRFRFNSFRLMRF